jgi:predicted RNA binding protein YcfA (HicA-like mRNA interferase family)
MPPVPLLRPNQVVKAFEKFGWQVTRKKGSHIIMTKEGNIATLSIPDHPHVARGTLRSLIQKSGLTIEQFIEAIQ